MTINSRMDAAANIAAAKEKYAIASGKTGVAGTESFSSVLRSSMAAANASGNSDDDTTTDGDATAAEQQTEEAQSTQAEQNTQAEQQYVLAPDGVTLLPVHSWETDTTDYAEIMRNAETGDAFLYYAQERVMQAQAQGIDISGNGSEPSNTEIFNEWYPVHGELRPNNFVSNGKEGVGYYGMDSDGHWGYYLDQALTQKHPDGEWDSYKASDGGQAIFDTKKGYLWPSNVRDLTRVGQTVTLVAGAKAFKVTYNEQGFPVTIINLTATRGIDGRTLDLPTARSLDDRGVNGQELLRAASGVDYAGPGSGVEQADIKGADYEDWDAIMAQRGYAVPQRAQPMSVYPGEENGSGAVQSASEASGQTEAGTSGQPVSQDSSGTTQAAASSTQAAATPAPTVSPEDDVTKASESTRANTAATTPAATSGTTAGTSNRTSGATLTEEQIAEAVRRGNITPEVLEAYEALFGIPLVGNPWGG